MFPIRPDARADWASRSAKDGVRDAGAGTDGSTATSVGSKETSILRWLAVLLRSKSSDEKDVLSETVRECPLMPLTAPLIPFIVGVGSCAVELAARVRDSRTAAGQLECVMGKLSARTAYQGDWVRLGMSRRIPPFELPLPLHAGAAASKA